MINKYHIPIESIHYPSSTKTISFVFLLAFLVFPGGISKDQIRQKLSQNTDVPAFAFEADISQTTSFLGRVFKDTGAFAYLPSDCFRISMSQSGVEVVMMGDTSWTVSTDGSVTRRINNSSSSLSSEPSATNPLIDRQFCDLIKTRDFDIIEEIPGKHVVIEVEAGEGTDKYTLQATYAVEDWTLRNTKMDGLPDGTVIETGYKYHSIEGHRLLEEINIVMGSMGFMRIKYSNFKLTKKVARSEFRKF